MLRCARERQHYTIASYQLNCAMFSSKMHARSLVPLKAIIPGWVAILMHFFIYISREFLCFIFGKVSRVQLQHNWQLINCILIKRSTKSPSICFPFLLFRRLRDCLEHNNNGGVSRYNLRIFGECEAICSVLFPQELRDKWERWLRCDKNTENVLRDEKRQNYNNKIM